MLAHCFLPSSVTSQMPSAALPLPAEAMGRDVGRKLWSCLPEFESDRGSANLGDGQRVRGPGPRGGGLCRSLSRGRAGSQTPPGSAQAPEKLYCIYICILYVYCICLHIIYIVYIFVYCIILCIYIECSHTIKYFSSLVFLNHLKTEKPFLVHDHKIISEGRIGTCNSRNPKEAELLEDRPR